MRGESEIARRRYFRLLVAAVPAIALLALIVACNRTLPEQALRNTIDGLQQAIEQRESGVLHNALADDFIGPQGLDRNGARRLALVLFLRNPEIGVTLGPLDVTMQGQHATVRCTAVLTGGSGGLLPDRGQLYDITSGWRLEGGDWRLTSITWTEH